MERILVVDDEREIADLIEIHLQNEGYKVLKAYNGQQALEIMAEEQDIHLLILDIMMPGIDGLEVCRRVRRERNLPIIFLTAKAEDMDKILGLSSGADDYMTKPFNLLELMARVKAQLRRYLMLNPQASVPEGLISVGGLAIDKERHRVTIDEKEISLTPLEFAILHLLASNPGRVFSSEEIFSRVWEEKYFDSNNTVMVHIRKLREKIEVNPREPRYIKTVWGIGYKLVGGGQA